MARAVVKRLIGLGLAMLVATAVAWAQTAALEGTVKLRGEDGALTNVEGATVDIYRLDITSNYSVKTDRSGRFFRIGLPVQGTYLIVVSASGIQPTWVNNVRLLSGDPVNIEVMPGAGNKLTKEEVLQAIAGQRGGAPSAAGPSAEERARIEAESKEFEARRKERDNLQGQLDQAIKHYNQGITFKNASNFEAALGEFEQTASVDPGKDPAFVEIAHKANANIAETRFQIGAELINKNRRAVPEAKPHFEKAVVAINKAIEVARTDNRPGSNNDLLVYYDILGKNVKLLVEFYSADDDVLEGALKSLEAAQAMDSSNKNKWAVIRGDILRFASRTDDAVAAYQEVLSADPNQLDAIYNLALALLADTARLQEAANYLADFVSKAPASDSRVNDARGTLELLKNEFKVEAERPATRRRR